MISILDNVLAGIILTTVTLVLLTTQLRAQRISIDTTVSYATRTSAIEVGSWLELDLGSAGKNMEPTERSFTNPVSIVDASGAKQTQSFTFSRKITNPSGSAGGVITESVRYTLQQEGTRTDATGTYPLYRVKRFVSHDGVSFTPAGSTPPLLRSFRITLHDALGQPVADPISAHDAKAGSIRTVRVRYAMVPPFVTETMPLLSTQHSASIMLANMASGVAETIELKPENL